MPEIRTDPVTGHRVILAPDRARRPDEFTGSATVPCVFCPGREAETPAEIARLPGPGGGWRARVVPNKYPALDAASGGSHEVVIESARHVSSFASLSEEEVADVLGLWQDRVRALAGGPGVEWVLIFKNEGAAAGASIEHVHSQVVGLNGPAPEASVRSERFRSACAICADANPARAVAQRGGFAARAPLAPRFPYEIRVAPASHRRRFEDEGDGALRALAALLLDLLGRLRAVLGPCPYNLALQTSPRSLDFHWHLEILPRTTRPGGFEWGTGTFINPVTPEDSARRLREAGA